VGVWVVLSRFGVVFLLLSLASCATNKQSSGYMAGYGELFSRAFYGEPLTEKKIKEAPYAMLQVSIGGRPKGLMTLGYLVADQQQWFDHDLVSIVTKNARVIALYNDEQEMQNLTLSPLFNRLKLADINYHQHYSLPFRVDYPTQKRFGLLGGADISANAFETRKIGLRQLRLLKIEERISIPASHFVHTNVYYKEVSTGVIWESVQKWGPDLATIHYVLIKPWFKVKTL